MFLPSTSRKWNRESERKTRKTEGEQGLSPGVENVITESSLMFHSGCLRLSWLQNWASWLDFGWCLSLSALDCLLEKQWNLIYFFFCAFSNSVPCSSGWRQVLYAEWLTLALNSWSPAATHLQSAGMTDVCYRWAPSHFFLVVPHAVFVVISEIRTGSVYTGSQSLGSVGQVSLHLYNCSN